ncbi:[acyl-carrier-protein] S-malonyltransferase [Alginatibacterium sediminis]|uniref:Malonyl CoA-acyl carrier protein transacylase n=1 Tax=Alginatibacterium sediminis TaxID=2164068 RepID=A0A420EHH8_9ALTE|nr:ACP S-malonyltransferase [Alginatibacterium sediminis]RKF20133.1 [acyl-carrier-protein] S-malonyltransferase [Alginatibacterium sediminis]
MSNLAFLFPGQGSQTVGMLSELAQKHGSVLETLTEASQTLGYDLSDLIFNGPVEKLNETHRTQPALLATSVALWRLWLELGGELPKVLAGHSLGEYSALTCAGVLDFSTALKLVEYRGHVMQEAVPAGVGAMSAIIGLGDSDIAQCCLEAAQGEIVAPVNYNSPGQVVIAGNKNAVERANIMCKEAGAKRALPLPVSVPSHCALMKPAAEKLSAYLDNIRFNDANLPVIHNVNVEVSTSAEQIKLALIAQLYSPVRWTETITKIASAGNSTLIECGPGKVLSGLGKRIDKQLTSIALNDSASLQTALEL